MKTDVFLSKVVEQVQVSFYISPNHTVCHLVEGDKKDRICVSTGCRGAVMMEAHGGNVLVGHPDMTRTLANVADSYYLPTMTADVEAFVRSCRVCAGAKTNTHLRMGVETFSVVPVTPFSNWVMDLIYLTGFESVCCRLGMSERLTDDNDV